MELPVSGDNTTVIPASLGHLYEASADSDSLLEDNDSASLGDDDAESCNWDSGDHCAYCDEDDVDDDDDDDQEHCSKSDVGFGFKCDELEEADRSCVDERGAIVRARTDGQKSSASVESAAIEALSEVEKNRLFWEACLAS